MSRTVSFPWGSLLRGIVTGDEAILGPIARIASAGAHVTIAWSILPRDGAAMGNTPLPHDVLTRSFDRIGLEVREIRPASIEEIRVTGSIWRKRLGAGVQRPVTLLRATKRSGPQPAGCSAARSSACVRGS